jgi:hypothetical protein
MRYTSEYNMHRREQMQLLGTDERRNQRKAEESDEADEAIRDKSNAVTRVTPRERQGEHVRAGEPRRKDVWESGERKRCARRRIEEQEEVCPFDKRFEYASAFKREA